MRHAFESSSAKEVSDLPCPYCGPSRQSASNRVRRVLRVWTNRHGNQVFSCIRCGAKGLLNAGSQLAVGPQVRTDTTQQTWLAQRLWKAATPLPSTPGETYIRRARGYDGPLQPTLRYLLPRGRHAHALIAAFGLVDETAFGELAAPNAPPAIHLTRLTPNGLTRLNKIMIGPVSGHPIVLAPVNDGLGLAIAEGIEDALSIHAATGLGAWAAGSAAHLAKLGTVIPDYVEALTIAEDDNEAGQRACRLLAEAALSRGIEVRFLRTWKARAA